MKVSLLPGNTVWQPASYFSGASNTGEVTAAVAAGEQVVPASELAAAMKQIKELQRLLGKKTMENELLKAVEYGRAKKWIAHAPIARGWGVKLSQPLSPGVACAVARNSQTNR